MNGVAARDPTAVLVVTVWRQGRPPRLVARVTYAFDVSQPQRVSVEATGRDEIEAVVARWLDELTAAGDGPVTQP
jgi:hypothetical protein